MTGPAAPGDFEKEPVSAFLSSSSSRLSPVPSLDFDAVYQEHFRFVWSTLLRLGVPRDAVEDACQETFLVVHRRLADFEGRGSPRAWLFGIARRVAYRVRRSHDRTRRKISALRGERRLAVSLEDAMAEHQLSAQLLDALDALDDDKREALTLHVFEEMSGPEVAGLLGLNVDTAYSRIKAGRRALKRVLAARGIDADMVELVRVTRVETEPEPGARGRIAALLAAPAASMATSVGVLGGVWKGLALAGAIGLVATAGLVGNEDVPSTASAGLVHGMQVPTPRVATVEPSPRRPASALPTVSPEVPPPVPRRPASSPTPAATPPPSASAHDVDLRAEVELIDRATAALRRDEPGGALAVLAEHARRFPRGQLANERRAYRAVALCSSGKGPQGRAEARLVRASTASKSLLAWLDDACGAAR